MAKENLFPEMPNILCVSAYSVFLGLEFWLTYREALADNLAAGTHDE